jgi:pimeloyl-ACP methyl ester carboxylesterase
MMRAARGKLRLLGAGAGSPTVVFEAGMGSSSSQWALVQPPVAAVTHVCSYDRPGFEGSPPARGVRDAENAANDLAALLKTAGEKPPFVLVGHSLGAIYVRVFASRFPRDVAGLVLVDPTPLDLKLGWAANTMSTVMMETLPILQRVGLAPLRSQAASLVDDLPEPARSNLIASYASLAHVEAMRDEFRGVPKALAQARVAKLSPDLPVAVLSAGQAMAGMSPRLLASAQEEHARFAAGFTGGIHRIVAGSTHTSLMTNAGHAAEVAEEIQRMVGRVQSLA